MALRIMAGAKGAAGQAGGKGTAIQAMNAKFIWDSLLDRPVERVSSNINGFQPEGGKMRWRSIIWINGYPFSGMEHDTEEEAERDAERVMDALLAWREGK